MFGGLSSLFRYRFYRKLVASYIVIVMVTVLVLSIALFSSFSSSVTKDLAENARTMLVRGAYAADIIRSQVFAVSGQVTNSSEISSCLYATTVDRIREYHAVMALDRLAAFNPYLQSVGLYNGLTGRYVNNTGIPSSEAAYSVNFEPMAFFPRRIMPEDSPNQKEKQLLTFVFSSSFSVKIPDTSIIEVNINSLSIRALVSGLIGYSTDIETAVLDRSGIELSGPHPETFMKDWSKESWAGKILSSTEPSGYFVDAENGEPRFVAYARSKDTGWIFISFRPYRNMIGNIRKMRNLTFLIVAILGVVGILSSTIIGGLLYSPMKRILEGIGPRRYAPLSSSGSVDEYKLLKDTLDRYDESTMKLRSSLQSSNVFIRKAYLLGLFRGDLDETIVPEERAAEFASALASAEYRVVVLTFDHFASRDPAISAQLLRFSASRLAETLFIRVAPCDAVSSDIDETSILLRLDKGKPIDDIVLAASEIRDECQERFGISLTTGIGDPAYSLRDLWRSYRSGREYCQYRLFFGAGAILDGDAVADRRNRVVRYPVEVEKKIIEALKRGDERSISDLVGGFFAGLAQISYFQAINYTSQLMFSVFRQLEDAIDLQDEDFKEYYTSIQAVEEAETIDELAEKVEGFCAEIEEFMHHREDLHRSRRQTRIVQEVELYAQDRYSQPDLSLDAASDYVGLSSGYVGKLFKTIKGRSFSDYLNAIRLEKARELLIATELPVAEICEKVGLYNVTYFSTLFKKNFGRSPSRWRDQF